MNLSKRLIILKHLSNFICTEYLSGHSSELIIKNLESKSQKFLKIQKNETISETRKMYLASYVDLIKKRILDFRHFRRKKNLSHYTDEDLNKVIDLRDRIIFKIIFRDQ